jgi:serine kinase
MPFDDSNIRKLVRYQLEKKIHFSRYKPLSFECKQLILSLLEPDLKLRINIFQIKTNDWINGRISSNSDLNQIYHSPTTNLHQYQ